MDNSTLSPRSALVRAAWFGLVGGYLDLGMIFLRKDLARATLFYEQGRHFRWTVPAANLVVLLIPGLLVAGANRVRPGLISRRAAAWLFATLALWGPLLRAPLHGAATLLVAAGLARWISRWIASHAIRFDHFARYSLAALAVVVAATAAVSHGRQAVASSRALARLPAPPAGAGNVLLIVLDTVRADNLGLYGYARDTTPHLSRWAKRGVTFDWALATAPWTFPSHASFLTGQWPSVLNAHWQPTLDAAHPTLAESLAARGYLTAGFAANTHWCSYESGLDRGFAHYEDYPLTPRTFLRCTVPGRWILKNLLGPRDYYSVKWIRSQSRDASGINRAFLDWLSRGRRTSRPFFAFLNYLDAHEPFLPPEAGAAGSRFGLRAKSPADYRMLLEYWDRDKLALSARDVDLARDSYDDCIAALDRQIGALLDELERRGVLRDSLVIITSDHGESFNEHGVFNHGYSLSAHEVRVPLLIIAPSAPPARAIAEPVSLRDLPATVVDLLGLGGGSPFPGRSLARCWRPTSGEGAPVGSSALSEVDIPLVIGPERGSGPKQRGFAMSLVTGSLHYLLDIQGTEELYDLAADPGERRDLRDAPGQYTALIRCRSMLRQLLTENRAAGGAAGEYRGRLRNLLESMTPAATRARPRPNSDTGGEFYLLLTRRFAMRRIGSSGFGPSASPPTSHRGARR